MATPTCSLKLALYLYLSALATFTLQVDGLKCSVCVYAESDPDGFNKACSAQTCDTLRDAAEATELLEEVVTSRRRSEMAKQRFINAEVKKYEDKGYSSAICARYERGVGEEPFVFHTCMPTTEAVLEKGPHCIEKTDIFFVACVCNKDQCTKDQDFGDGDENGATAAIPMGVMRGWGLGLVLLATSSSILGFLVRH